MISSAGQTPSTTDAMTEIAENDSVSNVSSSTKRGPYARSQQRRQEIAEAVLGLVDEVGHESVTTALVSKRSKTNEATVLYHFPSRDHLLVAALERADELTAELTHAEDPDVTLDLDSLRASADPANTNERRLRLSEMLKGQAATPDHPAEAYFLRRNRRAAEIYTRLIARRQAEGLAHPGLDPRQVALQMLALWEGLTSMWVLDRSVDVPSALLDGVRRLSGENWMSALGTMNDPNVGL